MVLIDEDILLLDAATKDDLFLYGSETSSERSEGTETDRAAPTEVDTSSLFNFCNYCRTEGGEAVLRRRMDEPYARADSIQQTQTALSFILENSDIFDALPSAYLAGSSERYIHENLPVVRQNNFIEFTSEAFSLWSGDDRFSIKISRGVELTARLLESLEQFGEQFENTNSAVSGGALNELLSEMQTLLQREGLRNRPVAKSGQFFLKKMRVDQCFRLHEKSTIDRLLRLVYEIDALRSLALVTQKHGFSLPEVIDPNTVENPVSVEAEGLYHPFVPNAVGNPMVVDQSQRVIFLTGPNMAGKTTYLRAAATALFLAHLGMGVPATRFRFTPVQRLLTAISLSDDLNDGISYFRAEALRVKAVAQAVADGYRVVAIMDEPFKGTNVKDAFDASLAVLTRFAQKPDCLFMVSSHLIELSEHLAPDLHIGYFFFEAQEQAQKLGFDYLIQPGVSSQRLGMRVLQEEGIFSLLDAAKQPDDNKD